MSSFDEYRQARVARFEPFLEKLLPQASTADPFRLREAIRYCALQGGKRLRPLLVYATGEALNHSLSLLDPVAASVELIHCYSLVHDDLPAMDDDDLRRGKPTCHKAFGEACAILTGDALQTLAFQILSDQELLPIDPTNQLTMLQILSQNSGLNGMINGQALDMAATDQDFSSFDMLCEIHQQKTGALIEACVQLGALASQTSVDPTTQKRLHRYAKCIGLSFQIQDDILDITQDSQTLGKTAGKDEQQSKLTFPSFLGIEASKKKAFELHEEAVEAISFLKEKGAMLSALSHHFVSRLN